MAIIKDGLFNDDQLDEEAEVPYSFRKQGEYDTVRPHEKEPDHVVNFVDVRGVPYVTHETDK